MNWLKITVIILAVAIAGLLAGLGVKALTNSNGGGRGLKIGSIGNLLDLPDDPNRFVWGITVLPFPFRTYRESFNKEQMVAAKKLGVSHIRLDYTPNNPKVAEAAVAFARDNGLKVVLVIPFGPKDIYTNKNLVADTQSYVSDIVKRFKGKVAVYQLATEVASVALGNNGAVHGIEKKDYPADKLAAVTTWVKTASETVKKTDPSAKRLVNDQWVHTGFFDNYFATGGDFDILGWNWFSDMGTDMATVTIDKTKNQQYQLLSKLEGYKKPIWLTEVSRRLGNQGGKEKEQADFITTMANYALNHSAIKGLFVFNLLEDQAASPAEKGYSIITAVDELKGQSITGYKPAFNSYQQIIKSHR